MDDIKSIFKMPEILFEKVHEDAQLPKKNHETDTGWDLFAVEDKVIPAKGRDVVDVGIKVAKIEPGYWVRVSSRSGLSFKHGILAHPGVIDQDYRGSMGVMLYNHSDVDYEVKKGDRVAQMLVHYNIRMDVNWGEQHDTQRGEKGFGSSGK
jgi:deoxyuridine 5'-triphosphate nucleotidohydrolase